MAKKVDLNNPDLQAALQDWRDNKLTMDGRGSWRWNNSATGRATEQGIHPANKLLKTIGGYAEVSDVAHGHVIPSKEYDRIRNILTAASDGSHMVVAEITKKYAGLCYSNPGARRSAYFDMVAKLSEMGIIYHPAEQYLTV